MRVLMFGWEYPPYAAGGLATATMALASGLARLGHAVTLVVPFPTDVGQSGGVRVLSASDVAPGLRVVRTSSPLTPYASCGRAGTGAMAPWAHRVAAPSAYRYSLFEDVDEFAAAARGFAADHPHDVIHVHDWMTYAAGREARAVSGAALVAHIHATEFDRSGDWPDAEISWREGEGLRAADRVIANSHVTKRQVMGHYGVPEDRVDVVHWGIDLHAGGDRHEGSPFGAGVPVVAFVGRVVMQKGPDYFVEAAARVAARHPTARFVVAGDGDMLPRLMDRCVELGIAHRVHFTGGLSREATERIYRMASVVVMPSVHEPFGLVALESLRAGTPVIASSSAGVAEAVANLIPVAFWDVHDMADKILAVLADAAITREVRARTAEELRDLRLGPDEPARLTAEVYDHAVATRRTPPHEV